MRIVLFGATGMIGQVVLQEAVDRGHTVTAVSRHPSTLDGQRPDVTFVQGDVTDARLVADLAAQADVVVSAVGGAAGGDPTVVVRAARSLLQAAGSTRMFVVGGAGSLIHPAGGTVSSQPDFPAAWRPASDAQGAALEIYRRDGADRDWTYLSPAHVIEPGRRTGSYRTGDDELVTDAAGESRISVEDYAVAVLDELERPRFRGRRFAVAW